MSRRSWANPAPLMFVGGSEDFLVRRERLRAFNAASTFSRQILRDVPQSEIEDTVQEADTFGSPVLVWVTDPKLTPDFMAEFAQRADNIVCLVLCDTSTVDPEKVPAPYDSVPTLYRMIFNRPTSRRDRAKSAVRFVGSEAKRLKVSVSDSLAEALVDLAGDDLGVLFYEMEKAATLARARGLTDLTPALLRETIRPSTDIDIRPLCAALVQRDATGIAKALTRLPGSEALPLLLRGKGGPADLALVWLQAAEMLDKGSSIDELSSRLGQPKWAVEKEIVPAAKRWGQRRLSRLVASLARVDSALLHGAPSAWNLLASSLISAASAPSA
jgi:DNA polymerase III delta subunit